jgi:SAM-dependent methyltransferase
VTDEPEFDARRYWEERLRRLPGLAGVGSVDYGKRYNEWLYRVRKRVFARLARSLPVDLSTARVLDVGSGTGFYLKAWRDCGVRDLTGSDLTEAAVDDLRRHFNFPVVQLDIAEPADIGPFDVVSAVDVLFHIVDDDRYAAAFRHLARIVRPGGYLVFSEHLPHDGTHRAPHRVSRDIRTVMAIAEASGFREIVRTPMFVLMEFPVDATPDGVRLRGWRILHRLARRERTGFLAGLVLYPVEMLLTATMRESPSTEFVVCRRAEAGT